jgi:FixJ family two-component response regulator
VPDRKGDALVAELRTVYPLLPIVLTSGHEEAGLRDRLKTHRSIAFLNKPYTTEQLCGALREVGVSC